MLHQRQPVVFRGGQSEPPFAVCRGTKFGTIRGSAKGCISCQGMYGCFGMTELPTAPTSPVSSGKDRPAVVHTLNLGATKWWIGGASSPPHTAPSLPSSSSTASATVPRPSSYRSVTPRASSFCPVPTSVTSERRWDVTVSTTATGFIQFTSVRVPRAYMLMKDTQVTREGEVREPPLQQLIYGALLQGRTAMVADAANTAKKALIIAVRYAAVRRQFRPPPSASPRSR
ncbi:hypothetical protein CF335_g3457 [Tilletia laevis]|nr:hypothetical protein CF335_g3457 [Tilletia laevis]